ncbi:MAG: radical SAM protein [Candidatus Marsarchaeota archaeon]|nr:radical SAM protein [Candidatus Marsarchaeota archaeon]
MPIRIKEIEAKHVLSESKLPDADYVVNPYTGCEFGCAYCYASFMGRFVNEAIDDWGNYVYVKKNAVSVFEKDLARMGPRERTKSIFFSSVTDPYQGVEAKYKLTRGILEVLARNNYPGEVGILTKSSMITRDIDVLHKIAKPDLGMTVTTTDDNLSRFLEVRASATSARLQTLKKLTDEGFRTFAFVGPLLPHFRYEPELLDGLFGSIVGSGVKEVYVEHMNLNNYIRKRLLDYLKRTRPKVSAIYEEAATDEHRKELDKIVGELLKKHGLKLRLMEVIRHNEWMKKG